MGHSSKTGKIKDADFSHLLHKNTKNVRFKNKQLDST